MRDRCRLRCEKAKGYYRLYYCHLILYPELAYALPIHASRAQVRTHGYSPGSNRKHTRLFSLLPHVPRGEE